MKSLLATFLFSASICFAQVMGPKISVLQPNFDFGDIKYGTTVSHDFQITNSGDDSLVIRDVRPGCGCTAVKPEKNVLRPGESIKINAQFNTIGRPGKQSKHIYVYSNDSENSEVRLSFTANVLSDQLKDASAPPKLQLEQTQHNFGTIQEGQIMDWQVNITNTGGSLLEIKDVKSDCGCTAALLSSKKLEPGQQGTLRIEFDSTNKIGKVSKAVKLFSNDSEYPEQTIIIYANIEKRK